MFGSTSVWFLSGAKRYAIMYLLVQAIRMAIDWNLAWEFFSKSWLQSITFQPSLLLPIYSHYFTWNGLTGHIKFTFRCVPELCHTFKSHVCLFDYSLIWHHHAQSIQASSFALSIFTALLSSFLSYISYAVAFAMKFGCTIPHICIINWDSVMMCTRWIDFLALLAVALCW